MTISSSLNAGVAGLSANASRLSTISDNIANSNTAGYKRAETEFHAMVIESGNGKYSAGGVRVTAQRLVDQAGSLISTTNSTDIAVRGRGFVPVTSEPSVQVAEGDDGVPFRLTTTGSFRQDEEGYLKTSTGMVLMGWPADSDGSIPLFPRDTADGLEPIQINVNQFASEPTTKIDLGINLPATSTDAGSSAGVSESSVEYFDNLGRSQNLNIVFTPDVPATGSSNTWNMTITDEASAGAVVGEYTLVFDDSTVGGGTLASVTTISGGAFDDTTGSFEITVDRGPIEVAIGSIGTGANLTQFSNQFAATQVIKDGSPIGNMVAVDIDPNGFVKATFDTGITRTIYQVPLVDLPNPNGLIAMDNQTYRTSPTSGNFFLWDAADGPTGDIVSFALEESATDVAGELTQLIQTQRAYSSNAKVIQTVDEMLQETTNIKR